MVEAQGSSHGSHLARKVAPLRRAPDPPASTGFFEMKLRYDESDNALIRASRALTDKVTDLLGEWGPQTIPRKPWRAAGRVRPSRTPGFAAPRGPVLKD